MPDRRRNAFDGVTDYFSELGRMRALGTHGTLHPAEHGPEAAERTHASAWVPVTDILAAGDDLIIQIELPGVGADHVDLRLSHGMLTVSGAQTQVSERVDVDYYVRERFLGEFRRTIRLPDGIEASHLVAEFGDGLVEITVRGAARPSRGTRIAVADRSAAPTTRGVATPD